MAVELYWLACYTYVVSVNVDKRVVEPGSEEYVDLVWELKERIRQSEGVLKQRKRFFTDAYRRSTAYLFVAREDGERLISFASVRRDGYVLFLAVAPEYRGQGFGERLMSEVADDHRTVTCHARTTNENAVEFYKHLGFSVERRIDRYYEDGGSAYYLKLGEDGLTDRISDFVRK